MRRREVIAGLGALGVVGAGAATFSGAVETPFGTAEQIEPIELPWLDDPNAPQGGATEVAESISYEGSDSSGAATERMTVPEPGQVTYLSLFATWCGSCVAKMDPLGEVAAEVSDEVQFVSVTNEPIGQSTSVRDVLEWWDEHDGDWPLLHDENLELTHEIDGQGVPYSVVFDSENNLVWRDSGYKSADEIREQLASVE